MSILLFNSAKGVFTCIYSSVSFSFCNRLLRYSFLPYLPSTSFIFITQSICSFPACFLPLFLLSISPLIRRGTGMSPIPKQARPSECVESSCLLQLPTSNPPTHLNRTPPHQQQASTSLHGHMRSWLFLHFVCSEWRVFVAPLQASCYDPLGES